MTNIQYQHVFYCDVVKHFQSFWRGFVSLFRCVELIICEQMNKYKIRLKDINSLEFAENKAKLRLTIIRRSMVRSNEMKCTLLSEESAVCNDSHPKNSFHDLFAFVGRFSPPDCLP